MTGRPAMLYLDPFECFADAENNGEVMGKALAAHPEVALMQKRLQELGSDNRSVIALRGDDLSYRAAIIEFSKSRYLRTAIVEIKPGDQNTFGDQVRTLREHAEQSNASLPWVLYCVDSGLPDPVLFSCNRCALYRTATRRSPPGAARA
jgi:hypothetical protein